MNKLFIIDYKQMNCNQKFIIRKASELVKMGINTPDWQRLISDKHVQQFIDYILTGKETNQFKQPILPGCITVCIDEQKNFYICDGQHRLKALFRVLEEHKIDIEVMCCDIHVKDSTEAEFVFKIVNSNLPMKKLARNVRLSDSNQVVIYFQSKYPNVFKDTDAPRKPHLNARQFSDQLAPVLKESNLTASEAISKLLWFNKIIEKFDPEDSVAQKAKEIATQKGGLYLGIFKPTYSFLTCCFKDENVINQFLLKKEASKQQIPKRLRDEVWKTYIGKQYTGNCYACNNLLDCSAFECGHVVAEHNGGNTYLTNLRPICSSCNRSCGIQNLDDFKQKFS